MLCGDSSVGKTSVAEQLQLQLTDPFLHVGLDHFFSMFPHHWKGHPRGPGTGFWYEDTIDPDGKPRAQIRHGDAGDRMLAGMRAAVNALLEVGNDVIVDEMPINESILPSWRQSLVAREQFWVKLTAPLTVLEAREQGRAKGQKLGNARGHHGVLTTSIGTWSFPQRTSPPHRLLHESSARCFTNHRLV